MTGAAIAIDDAAAADTILSVKQRVFAINRKLRVSRQRLMYRPGPFGIDPLADDETLGGAGVARDGSAELDVLLADFTETEVADLGPMVMSGCTSLLERTVHFLDDVFFIISHTILCFAIVLSPRCRLYSFFIFKHCRPTYITAPSFWTLQAKDVLKI